MRIQGIAWLVMIAALGAGCDEPGKVRGNMSTGARSAEPPDTSKRFVIDTGDALITMNALNAVRKRLAPLGILAKKASIVGATVVVDVEGPKADKARAALEGARVDVFASSERLIRGESLNRAQVVDGALELVFAGSAKAATVRAKNEELAIVVKLDGADHEATVKDEGVISVTMDAKRAMTIASGLNGKALSHDTKVEQKAVP